jgi:caffeoyl-CoA O-methyltransferase
MQIAPEQGQFMSLLVQLMNAKKILEIGVFTGYSSLSMALALPPEGQIIACDVSEEYTSIARRYWERAGLANKINLRLAPALETLDELIASGETESFDFVFIDADKENHPAYFERALILVRQGGLIVVDNAFWDGKVADAQYQDEETQAIRTLNEKLHYDDRVSLSLLPIADGLVLALKR